MEKTTEKQQFNLLPPELSRSKSLTQTTKILEIVALSVVTLFIILLVAGFATFFFLARDLTNTRAQNEVLTQSITSFESSERNLILVKDRIEKIGLIFEDRGLEESLLKQKDVVDSVIDSGDVSFSNTSLDGDISKLGLLSRNSKSLSAIFEDFRRNPKRYTVLHLLSLSFNPFLGYYAEFDIK